MLLFWYMNKGATWIQMLGLVLAFSLLWQEYTSGDAAVRLLSETNSLRYLAGAKLLWWLFGSHYRRNREFLSDGTVVSVKSRQITLRLQKEKKKGKKKKKHDLGYDLYRNQCQRTCCNTSPSWRPRRCTDKTVAVVRVFFFFIICMQPLCRCFFTSMQKPVMSE